MLQTNKQTDGLINPTHSDQHSQREYQVLQLLCAHIHIKRTK